MRWLASFGKKLKDHHGSRLNTRRARPCLEDLESRVVLYSASGNLWPSPQLITISFMPDGTNVNGQTSNLMSKFNSQFGSTSTWENLILQAAQLWAQQTNINFAVVPDNGSPDGSGNYQQGDPGIWRHPHRRLQLQQLRAGPGLHAAPGEQLLDRRRHRLQHRTGLQERQHIRPHDGRRPTRSATPWGCCTAASPAP